MLGAYDELTAKYDDFGEPILYPLPLQAEEKGKAARLLFTHEVEAYESLEFD